MNKAIQNKMRAGAEKRLALELGYVAELIGDGLEFDPNFNLASDGYEIAPDYDIEADVYADLTDDEWYEAADGSEAEKAEWKKFSDSLCSWVISEIEKKISK